MSWFWQRRRDVEEEISIHIAERTDELKESGIPEDEALRLARREFGNISLITEASREVWGWTWLDRLGQDLRYAFRMLTRNPGHAIGAIVSLGLGIGAATAVFSAVEGLVLNPYPYTGADRLVVMSQVEGAGPSRRTFLTGDQARLLSQARSLDAVILWDQSWMWTRNEGIPEMVQEGRLSQNVFQLLGVPPLVGRTFTDEWSTATSDSALVAVLSYRYWQTHYAGASNVIGRTLQVDDQPYTIIGIMPERFRFSNVAFYIPLPSGNDRRSTLTLLRLRPGVSTAAATAELQALVQQQQFDPTKGRGGRRDVRVSLTTLRDDEAGNLHNMLGILLGAVTLLFVIGCANVSILLIGRGIQRRYELAVRHAVGASQTRILRQLLTESLVVSMAGGVVGVAVAYALLAVIIAGIPPGVIPGEMDITIDSRVLVFAAVVAVLAGVAAGLSPALALSRSKLSGVGGRSQVGTRGTARTHRLLTLVQCAATVVLLAAAGAALRTLVVLTTAPLGYNPQNVAVFGATLHGSVGTQEMADYAERIRSAAVRVPGVESVALTGPQPTPPVEPRRSLIEIPGVLDDDQEVVTAEVSREYFSTIRVPIRAGRIWTDTEDRRRANVGVINETMARRYWPNGNPIGQRVRLAVLGNNWDGSTKSPANDPWIEIVGVIGDVRNDGLRRPVVPEIYVPYSLRALGAVLLLIRTSGRTSGAPEGITDELKRKVAEVNAEQPLMASTSLEERLWENGWARQQFAASLFSACAALALALAAVGMYSVVACAVSLRTREFALRMALGASNARILREIFTSSMMTIVLGMGGGLALVAILHRPITAWTESSLWSPVSLTSSMIALAVVGCGAVLIPAWRAATMDPMRILRTGE